MCFLKSGSNEQYRFEMKYSNSLNPVQKSRNNDRHIISSCSTISYFFQFLLPWFCVDFSSHQLRPDGHGARRAAARSFLLIQPLHARSCSGRCSFRHSALQYQYRTSRLVIPLSRQAPQVFNLIPLSSALRRQNHN